MTEEIQKKSNEVWKNIWFQRAALLILGIAGFYGIVYWDVVSRAKESYAKAEMYKSWHESPQEKINFFNEKYNASKKEIEGQLKKGKITEEEFREKLSVFEFDKEFHLQESSLKYAYQYYKDTYELFSPPESKWVKLAREKAPQTLDLWKAELTDQGIKFEDYMFE